MSPARDAATGLYSSAHGTAVHAGPPQGHFKVNHRGDLSFHTFHHDAPSGGVERVSEPAKPSEPGQIMVRAVVARMHAVSAVASSFSALGHVAVCRDIGRMVLRFALCERGHRSGK